MTDGVDPIHAAGTVTRVVRRGEREGRPTRSVVARRWYAAERAELWDAITNAARLPRWFLPISGELQVGGRYQLTGNAGGVIEACEEPVSFAVTWEFAEQVSWLQVHLEEHDGGTVLEVNHEAYVDAMWEQFGPGAAGVGWDLALYGLDLHLSTGAPVDPAEAQTWTFSDEGRRFVQLAGDGWVQAAVGDGDAADQARSAGERVIAFYTTPPEQADT